MDNNIKGKKGEIFITDYLIDKGFKIRENNYHSRYGEVDIICENDKYIVFVEVKTRKQNTVIRGIEAVTQNKKLKIIKTAWVYLLNNPCKKQPRYDVAEVIANNKGNLKIVNYFENAFDTEEYDAFF